MPLARRLVNGRERGCLQVVPCIVLRLVNMSTRAMRLKTQAHVLACSQASAQKAKSALPGSAIIDLTTHSPTVGGATTKTTKPKEG